MRNAPAGTPPLTRSSSSSPSASPGVPFHIILLYCYSEADFSHLLYGRGVTLYAHAGENAMRLHQEPIPCRLREATFVLDGLTEHETELDPYTVFTDTHGYTEVVMATAALLGKALEPRIARMHEL